MGNENNKTRIDKWLWAVRIYKTRSQATKACQAGKVKINGVSVKPSRQVTGGEIISVRKRFIVKTLEILGIIEKRVSAKITTDYLRDLTPPEEKIKLKSAFAVPKIYREKGMGRPTKKERRELEKFRKQIE